VGAQAPASAATVEGSSRGRGRWRPSLDAVQICQRPRPAQTPAQTEGGSEAACCTSASGRKAPCARCPAAQPARAPRPGRPASAPTRVEAVEQRGQARGRLTLIAEQRAPQSFGEQRLLHGIGQGRRRRRDPPPVRVEALGHQPETQAAAELVRMIEAAVGQRVDMPLDKAHRRVNVDATPLGPQQGLGRLAERHHLVGPAVVQVGAQPDQRGVWARPAPKT
jgi:hypothetical protein